GRGELDHEPGPAALVRERGRTAARLARADLDESTGLPARALEDGKENSILLRLRAQSETARVERMRRLELIEREAEVPHQRRQLIVEDLAPFRIDAMVRVDLGEHLIAVRCVQLLEVALSRDRRRGGLLGGATRERDAVFDRLPQFLQALGLP